MSEYIIQKDKTVCFSGHRPEKLPDNGDMNSEIMKILKSLVYQAAEDSIMDGYNCFITGLARGFDLLAADVILDMKRSNPNIHLVAAIPCRSQGKGLKGYEKFIYGCVLNEADKVVYISENYHSGCMKQRNRFMVDNSSKIIAAVSDYKSGTGQTIGIARREGLDVSIIDLRKLGAYKQEALNDPTQISFRFD